VDLFWSVLKFENLVAGKHLKYKMWREQFYENLAANTTAMCFAIVAERTYVGRYTVTDLPIRVTR
jgi:hypothetical protein